MADVTTDAPVSNSGRLAALIRKVVPVWVAETIADPDTTLTASDAVVAKADAGVLDCCGKWISLARALIEQGVSECFVVDLH